MSNEGLISAPFSQAESLLNASEPAAFQRRSRQMQEQ
jgi:hypothetical protein